MKIEVVGLDPSLSNLGICRGIIDLDDDSIIVKSLKLVETKGAGKKKVVRQNSEDLERAMALYQGLQEGCQGAKLAFVEIPVGSQSARAMASYGICLGVLASCPIPIIQVTPTEVKKAGYGVATATKREMIDWATATYPDANWLTVKRGGQLVVTDKNEHLADAAAAISAGIQTDQFRQLASLMRGMS